MAASVDQTAPATHATANEQRCTKAQSKVAVTCQVILIKRDKKPECIVGSSLYIIVNKTATGFANPFAFKLWSVSWQLWCVFYFLLHSYFVMGIGVKYTHDFQKEKFICVQRNFTNSSKKKLLQ